MAASRNGNRVIDTSPERTKVWTNISSSSSSSSSSRSSSTVPVIYYLYRRLNGQLEHPHFMEVPLSNPLLGLHLRDVINRLNLLRGIGMASMYSWSCKRSYKNGYVWHDLTENDLIYPAQGREYILKGSEMVVEASKCEETSSSRSGTGTGTFNKPPPPPESSNFPTVAKPRRRHQSWSSVDFHEYGVYTGETSGHISADASTQTDDRRRRRRPVGEIEAIEEEKVKSKETEISTDEISPPPSDASPETLEKLIKADCKVILRPGPGTIHDVDGPSMTMNGRSRASTVLMQLLTCGSIGFKDCGGGGGGGNGNGRFVGSEKKMGDSGRSSRWSGLSGRLKQEVEEKEYYSGSIIIGTKKEIFPALKRSSSYSAAHRSSKMEMTVKESGGGKCKG